MVNIELLMAAVMDSRDGITISDFSLPDNPLIFVNPAFERMTGYSSDEVVGKNCRYLQREDKNQRPLETIREAIKNKQACLAKLRNYRKDGSMFWNELSISPIFGPDGQATHFLGIQKDVTSEVLLNEKIRQDYEGLRTSHIKLEEMVNIDPLSGIHNRRYLDQQLEILWKIASRLEQKITILMIDIDHFKQFNDTYGHPAGDKVITEVAQTLETSFLKSTDFVARYGGEEFMIITLNEDTDKTQEYAKEIVNRVQKLRIPHNKSTFGHVTVSIGFSSCKPNPKISSQDLVNQADQAMYEAKSKGRNIAIKYLV